MIDRKSRNVRIVSLIFPVMCGGPGGVLTNFSQGNCPPAGASARPWHVWTHLMHARRDMPGSEQRALPGTQCLPKAALYTLKVWAFFDHGELLGFRKFLEHSPPSDLRQRTPARGGRERSLLGLARTAPHEVRKRQLWGEGMESDPISAP